MKRYIFFCATLERGGAERVVSILSSELVRQGKKVEIVVYYDRGVFYQIDDNVKITSVEKKTKSRNLVCNLLWMRNYFRENALLVCSFISSFNMLALLATRGLGIPVIVSERTDPMRKNWIYRRARDFLYSFADVIVTQTKKSRAYFLERTKRRCATIYNPISSAITIGYALSANKEPLIVSVGRLEPVKNQALLLRAFKRVNECFPEYRLIVYGEGSCRAALEQLREELGLSKSVELPGEMDNIFEAISSAQMFVLSSDFEGMPNALLEAMCLGLPVISTKVSGAMEVIEDGYNGLLVEIGDESGLVSAIHSLLGDEALRNALASRATESASKLDLEEITSQWNRLLDRG